MFYKVEGTFEEIFEACGLDAMLKIENNPNNDGIVKDLYNRTVVFRVPGIENELKRNYLPQSDIEGETPIRNRFMQGDADGGNLKFILGNIPFFDQNDPEANVETALPNVRDARGAYLDSKGNPAALAFFYRKDKPNQWLIIVAKDTHLPKDQRKAYILSSVDPKSFMVKYNEKVQNVTLESLPEQLDKLKTTADSTAMGNIIGNIFNEDKTIKQNALLFHDLFTGRLKQDVGFDDHKEWMELIENHSAEIMNNPILIALHSMDITNLSKEEIRDCLNEESQLSKILKEFLGNESLKEHPGIKKELFQLTLNLYNLGHIKKFSKFAILPEEAGGFFDFFNKLAEAHPQLVKRILDDDKLESLRLVHQLIQKPELMKLFQNSDDQEQLIDQLMGLNQFISEVQAPNKPKDEVLSLIVEFILRDLGRGVIPENPLIALKNDIPNIQNYAQSPNRLIQFYEYKKLINFLNQAQGIEKIKPELLSQFLAENLHNDELLNLFKSVQETVVKLDTLKVGNSESYALALSSKESSKEFRKIVAELKVEEVEKSKRCIELAINLEKLNKLEAAYPVLSSDLKWVNSFNQFVKNEGLKDILVDKIHDNVESCKPVLENPIFNALVSANIKVKKTQGYKILDSQEALSKILQAILIDTNSDQSRKNALYQLAIDLDELGVLGSFDEFKTDDNEFLKLFNKLCAISGSDKLLTPMLAGFAPGLGVLRLMAYSDSPLELFKKLLDEINENVIQSLDWLNRNRFPVKITSMAIEFLFKQPNINSNEFKSVVKFLENTPKCDADRSNMVDFLVANHKNSALLSKVTAAYKKLDALGVVHDQPYKMAVKEELFRNIVLNLLPFSVEQDQSCGLQKVDQIPNLEALKAYDSSNYFLTKKELYYYNKSNNKLVTIQLEASQLDELNKKFPNTIDKLTEEHFKQLRDIAHINKHNKNLIELAVNLQNFGFLGKYEHFASNTQLVSSFIKLAAQYQIKLKLAEKLGSEDFLNETKSILENKRLIALTDAKIEISNSQLSRLLEPESEKSKAMDILLALNLNTEKVLAYKLAIIDSPTAKNFRAVLFEINKIQVEPETKSKMIETLCSLQIGDRKGKDVFSMYLNTGEEGKKFRSSIFKIEETCTKIKTRWNEEKSEDASAKTRSFEVAEQEYRKGLYGVVFDNQDKPMSKKDFEANIAQVSQNMLTVVDVRRRSWIIAIMETLAEALNVIAFTLPSRISKGRALFFGHTTSGYEVRDLHESLKDPKIPEQVLTEEDPTEKVPEEEESGLQDYDSNSDVSM